MVHDDTIMYNEVVNDLNARLTMLDTQAMESIKSKGLTRKDARLIWSRGHNDQLIVKLHFERGNFPDEQLKF